MNKYKKILYLLAVFLCFFSFNFYTAFADDDGYYIKNMDVKIDANDKREFKIKETIDVYFNEERHGIIRTIPKEGSLEDYNITDVNVEGAPFEKDDSANLELKIGDKDETIEGDKTYVITYTLKFYNDEQANGDYIYLNILGDEWDTYIENFTSTVTYPKNSTLENINITDGEYGSKTSTYTKYTTNQNKINISSKSTIPANCAVTINAKLNEGAFKNAPMKKYPYTIKSDIVNAKITDEKNYIINRDYIVEINEQRDENNLINLYLWENYSNDYIKNVNIDNQNISFNSSDNALVLPKEKGIYKFKVTYEVEPVLAGDVNFYINTPYDEGKTEKLKVNITSPFNIDDYYVNFMEKGVNFGTKRYTSDINNKTLTFTNLNNVNAGEYVNFTLQVDNNLFKRPTPFVYYVFLVLSLLTLPLFIFSYIKNKDKEPFISAIEFYPPQNLNSADVAYAYNQKVSTRDMVSLIFYWASHNHIKITINKDKSFMLEKINKLDDKHKIYEKTIFKDLFKAGDDKSVTDEQLEDATIESINSSRKDVKDYFKNEKDLNNRHSIKKARLISLLPIIIILLNFIYNGILSHNLTSSLFMSLILIVSFLIFSNLFISISKNNSKNKYISENKIKSILLKSLLLLIYIIINIFISLYNQLSVSSNIITLLISIIDIVLCGLIVSRSDYGKDILAKIEGFKNFIEVAEKERLEALLEDDPYYFYNTLPFAQVLGVTKKWIDKFDKISMQQPPFYNTYYPMNDIYAISMLNSSLNNITSTVSSSAYAPSSSSDGFGGGGFSGGGGGGGGGSSW